MAFADLIGIVDRLVNQHVGETVRCSRWGVDPWVSVRGVFSAQYQIGQALDTGVMSSSPAVFVRVADLPVDPDSDETLIVERGGTQYRVRESQKDGDGGVLLLLAETDG
jgi:hypothetical protein